MKLTRKALAAAATTVALTTAGLSAPAFAEEQAPAASSELFAGSSAGKDATGENTTDTGAGSADGLFDGSSDENGKTDPAELRSWISVFTAIIGALSAAFVFIQRLGN